MSFGGERNHQSRGREGRSPADLLDEAPTRGAGRIDRQVKRHHQRQPCLIQQFTQVDQRAVREFGLGIQREQRRHTIALTPAEIAPQCRAMTQGHRTHRIAGLRQQRCMLANPGILTNLFEGAGRADSQHVRLADRRIRTSDRIHRVSMRPLQQRDALQGRQPADIDQDPGCAVV
jgi:hypothetical protein